MMAAMKRIIVGMTGASGAILGVRLVEALAELGAETHLVLSKWARQTLEHETATSYEALLDLATESYGPTDMSAKISSGSFPTDGMAIVPCSVRTVAAIAHGLGEHLVHRAADVVLKEKRKLVLAVREMPFGEIHLENMLKLARMGVVIMPPVPGFYNHPQSVDDVVDHIVMRILDQFDLEAEIAQRWDGEMRGTEMRGTEMRGTEVRGGKPRLRPVEG